MTFYPPKKKTEEASTENWEQNGISQVKIQSECNLSICMTKMDLQLVCSP